MANKIQIKRGLKDNLPILDVGEPAFTTDTKEFFVGDGSTNIEFSKQLDLDQTNIQLGKLDQKKVDKIDYVRSPGYAATSSTNIAYTIILSPAPTAYADGMQITILPHVDCGANPTLNINGLGGLTILNQDGSVINAGDIKANKPLSLVRVGSNFFIRSAKKITIYDKLYKRNPWAYIGANVPTQRYKHECTVMNDKIYVLGGLDFNKVPLSTFEIFDIPSNTWITGPNMLSPKFNLSVCAWNNKIYVLGSNSIEVYDIASNTWSVGATMPSGSTYSKMTAQAYNNKIYVISGTGLYIYDIDTNKWSTGANMPISMLDIVSCIDGDKIYVRGNDSSTYSAYCYGYNITTNVWFKYISGVAYGASVQVFNNKVYFIGGYGEAGRALEYTKVYDLNNTKYQFADDVNIPTARFYSTSCKYKGKIFMIGGCYGNIGAQAYFPVNTVEIYVADWVLE